jgi:hypothetical protein
MVLLRDSTGRVSEDSGTPGEVGRSRCPAAGKARPKQLVRARLMVEDGDRHHFAYSGRVERQESVVSHLKDNIMRELVLRDHVSRLAPARGRACPVEKGGQRPYGLDRRPHGCELVRLKPDLIVHGKGLHRSAAGGGSRSYIAHWGRARGAAHAHSRACLLTRHPEQRHGRHAAVIPRARQGRDAPTMPDKSRRLVR